MSDAPPSERLGLRGTLDLISSAFRTAGTGAITAGASYRFFSDKPDIQWAIKYFTLVFLFGVVTFAVSYIMLLLATIEVDQSLARSSEQNGRKSCGLGPRKQPQSMASLLSELT